MTLPDRTPRSVALAAGAVVSLVTFAIILVIFLAIGAPVKWGWFLLYLPFGFFIAYRIIYIFIERFLYRKVKIIYKTIHSFQTKTETTPRIIMGTDILGEINEKVEEWAEEKIREVKQLKATENFRKDFIGNLAHELKTPIFNIQGYIDTLLDSDLSDAELHKKFLEKAAANCDRLSDLIKDLDQITLFESGRMPLSIGKFDLIELAKKTVESVEQQAKDKRITILIRHPLDKPIQVLADRNRIEQVLINLLINSINYGREGGETRIRFYDMEDNMLIEVVDNGIGMTKEHLPRVFERFYRVDKSRSRNAGGSGLGLAICKHIIEAHQQTITVRSTEDVGSTFAFTLKKAQTKSMQ